MKPLSKQPLPTIHTTKTLNGPKNTVNDRLSTLGAYLKAQWALVQTGR